MKGRVSLPYTQFTTAQITLINFFREISTNKGCGSNDSLWYALEKHFQCGQTINYLLLIQINFPIAFLSFLKSFLKQKSSANIFKEKKLLIEKNHFELFCSVPLCVIIRKLYLGCWMPHGKIHIFHSVGISEKTLLSFFLF